MVQISELYVYPVKGAAGIPLRQATLDDFGIRHDRRWMIVDAAGRFITQRNQPRLALLQPELEPDRLVLSSPMCGRVELPLEAHGPARRVQVWDDVTDAVDAGDVAAGFVSRHLDAAVRLLFMPDNTLRQVSLDYARPGDRVSFADGFPLLLIGQASLDELNRRLPDPVAMVRFRPNIVVAGATPHAEDGWRRLRVGDVDLDVVKPCARCAVPNVDPETAVAGREPTRTLAGYRRWDGKIWFGQNVLHRSAGVLRVGDPVEVLAPHR
jgi:uncharacterized protein